MRNIMITIVITHPSLEIYKFFIKSLYKFQKKILKNIQNAWPYQEDWRAWSRPISLVSILQNFYIISDAPEE